MQIDSKTIKQMLYDLKQQTLLYLDKSMKNKVRERIDERISNIDSFIMWINTAEQKEELTMQDLKLGELTTFQPKAKKSTIDDAIVADAQVLKKNYQAIKVNVTTIPWTTFSNRTYQLREEGRISEHVVPRKDKDGVAHLVYLDKVPARRSHKVRPNGV
jgi:hypothetical protein